MIFAGHKGISQSQSVRFMFVLYLCILVPSAPEWSVRVLLLREHV
jgi:hypothetical protein